MNPEVHTLDSGERVLFRPVQPDDKRLLLQGFGALSRESRYQRFSMPKNKLTDAELVFYTELDGINHFAVAAGLIDDEDQLLEGLGIARYVSVVNEAGLAEIAVIVLDGYQNKGIGTRLMKCLLAEAERNGLTRLRAYVQRTNRTAMLLVEKCVEQFDVALDGSYRVFTWKLQGETDAG